MFDNNEIAKRALLRAEEIRAEKKRNLRRFEAVGVIVCVCAAASVIWLTSTFGGGNSGAEISRTQTLAQTMVPADSSANAQATAAPVESSNDSGAGHPVDLLILDEFEVPLGAPNMPAMSGTPMADVDDDGNMGAEATGIDATAPVGIDAMEPAGNNTTEPVSIDATAPVGIDAMEPAVYNSPRYILPGYGDVTVRAGERAVKISLPNAADNDCYLTFEIVLAEGDETIYKSDILAPGMRIDSIELLKPLAEGEYGATLIISAYAYNKIDIIGISTSAFALYAIK